MAQAQTVCAATSWPQRAPRTKPCWSRRVAAVADLRQKRAHGAQINSDTPASWLRPTARSAGGRWPGSGVPVRVMSFVDGRWAGQFRETQLTNIVGNVAEVRVDVYPGEVARGKVLEIAPASGSQFALLPPDNATGNFTKVIQRVPVKIALDDSPLTAKLRPGLSAVVTVQTRDREHRP